MAYSELHLGHLIVKAAPHFAQNFPAGEGNGFLHLGQTDFLSVAFFNKPPTPEAIPEEMPLLARYSASDLTRLKILSPIPIAIHQ